MFENLFTPNTASSSKPSPAKGQMFSGLFETPKPPTQAEKIANAQKLAQEATAQAQKAASPMEIAKQTVSGLSGMATGIGKGVFDGLFNLPKNLYQQYTQPSETAKKVEKLYGVGSATSDPVAAVGQKSYDVIVKALTRTFAPAFEGTSKDIADTIVSNELAPQVASGKIPASVLDEMDALKKTNAQVFGDVAQTVLAIYSPTFLKEGAVLTKGKPIANALLTGGIRGAGMGTSFGAAQVLSSGTKDPQQIASTMAQNITSMGLLGAITSGVIPVSAKVLKDVVKAKAEIKSSVPAPPLPPPPGRTGIPVIADPTFVPEPMAKDLQPLAQEAKKVPANPKDVLTKGFEKTAEYNPIVIKEISQKATDLVNSNIEAVRKVIRGEEPIPEGHKGIALITAVEEYIKKNPNIDIAYELAYELANSPLVSGTSLAAQELRLAAERIPDTATAKLQATKKVRESEVKGLPAKKQISGKKLKDEVNKNNLSKEEASWDNFLTKITC